MRVLQKNRLTGPWDGEYVASLAFFPNQPRLISVGAIGDKGYRADNGEARIWDWSSGEIVASAPLTGVGSFHVAVAPDGEEIAIGSKYGMSFYRADPFVQLSTYLDDSVRAMIFSGNGRTLYYVQEGHKEIGCLHHRLGQLTKRIPVEMTIASLALNPFGNWLAVGGKVDLVQLHRTDNGSLERTLNVRGHIGSLAFSPDNQLLAVAHGRQVGLWNPHTGEHIETFGEHTHVVNAVAFSPDGKLLASGGTDGEIRFWDVDSGSLKARFDFDIDNVLTVAFSPDGLICAAGGKGAINLVVWDVDG